MTTTTTTYLGVTQNLSRYRTMTAADATVRSATAYYQKTIGSVKSLSDFVGNYRLVSYALNAYGLGDQIASTALIRKVLEGGVTNPRSLANTLRDSRWHAFAKAFDFIGKGAASISAPGAVATTTGNFVEQELENSQGAQDVGVQLALYFRRVAPTVTSEFGILADSNLLQVAQTILGLSPATGATDIDTQARSLARLMPVSDLRDPVKLDRLTERFAAMYDLTYGANSGSTSSLAVSTGASSPAAASILGGIISLNGQIIGSALAAFTGVSPSLFSNQLLTSLQRLPLGG
jgi:hypothetical protein